MCCHGVEVEDLQYVFMWENILGSSCDPTCDGPGTDIYITYIILAVSKLSKGAVILQQAVSC